MIKRRFYKEDHGDRSASSSSSSSESDPDPDSAEEEGEEDVEEQEEEEEEEEQEQGEEGSGYKSEESSGNEVEEASIGLVAGDEEQGSLQKVEANHKDIPLVNKASAVESGNSDAPKNAANLDDPVEADLANCILKCKSVFKCKLCPRIICLTEDTVRTHLKSKRHARSKKLLGEGRLKLMLNSDGELEEEQETHAERHARTIATAQQAPKAKKDTGRQRQSRRRKKRQQNCLEKNKEQQIERSNKRRRKTDE